MHQRQFRYTLFKFVLYLYNQRAVSYADPQMCKVWNCDLWPFYLSLMTYLAGFGLGGTCQRFMVCNLWTLMWDHLEVICQKLHLHGYESSTAGRGPLSLICLGQTVILWGYQQLHLWFLILLPKKEWHLIKTKQILWTAMRNPCSFISLPLPIPKVNSLIWHVLFSAHIDRVSMYFLYPLILLDILHLPRDTSFLSEYSSFLSEW